MKTYGFQTFPSVTSLRQRPQGITKLKIAMCEYSRNPRGLTSEEIAAEEAARKEWRDSPEGQVSMPKKKPKPRLKKEPDIVRVAETIIYGALGIGVLWLFVPQFLAQVAILIGVLAGLVALCYWLSRLL